MNRVRIVFLKAGKAIKVFDRQVANYGDKKAAEKLAAEIAKDSGVEHDARQIVWERKCEVKLFADAERKKLVELLHTRGMDEADALKRIAPWMLAKKIDAAKVTSTVRFLE